MDHGTEPVIAREALADRGNLPLVCHAECKRSTSVWFIGLLVYLFVVHGGWIMVQNPSLPADRSNLLFVCHANLLALAKRCMTLLAIIFPWLSFILRGRILTGILCLILQCTLIGWIPAAAWAVISLNNARAERRTDRIVKAINKQQGR